MRYLTSCCRLVGRVGISMRIGDRIVVRLCVGVRAGVRAGIRGIGYRSDGSDGGSGRGRK